jgi:hypothetical protein
MTPKDEALELYNKYEQLGRDFTRGVSMKEFAKQCALIAVEFAREQFNKYCLVEVVDDDHFDVLRQEIEKL